RAKASPRSHVLLLSSLRAERACRWLAHAINDARKGLEFALWAYVFMPEHVHLLIYPRRPQYDVQIILQNIKEPVGRQAVEYLRRRAPHWLPKITIRRGNRVERR